jgi:alkylhydroperoxidase family enzyme
MASPAAGTTLVTDSWLSDLAPGERPFDRVVDHRPEYAAALEGVEAAIWNQDAIDPAILVLCQYRISALLGAAPAVLHGQPDPSTLGIDDQLARLAAWPTDPAFTDAQRTCIAYAEQLLFDAAAVTDVQASEVIDAVGQAGFIVLTYSCGIFETRLRAELVLGIGR